MILDAKHLALANFGLGDLFLLRCIKPKALIISINLVKSIALFYWISVLSESFRTS